ncbi:phosphonate metabolism protein/1,5-bisphosphokinase (PRPP-forming) PhnN [Pseudosulfitobacter pseudonitzschiae]|uniref:Ribose 1,5-bisphosphate phosphokinase PhnN n=1 Tax=Pseudosulfitobacter pseudonitzschiae TaxID=1402135 RepID=A0A073J450_9RHOB|nr:phosphonate metabolism protein/1,5-bisphosphokinase (PRPP-forming) PhnN [Pseudosulfitobacter pseudonitzschiae]KEJ96461.1 ribose-phosphate pyrophosphokinase [Pseudosulfitobacter pseudonitzschiae]MBM1813946.1 phosphonate metabolism protein/1,5-bisphosphokinase (PRPP-forming) PhnN [Pseudosulfitobacter pseudonitzschiae]MBM1830939.1 phosphonate metabolism protein/1,5-bisphosphokinase (PRPP-forming) PhnN [Pseudosulfitobacter pseudonitzschiae]MBM1835806.1 phosphonate metabolism protein/1,5-bisphosp
MSGRMIAVVGPSGVGKDTVMQALVDAAPQLSLVRRVITRAADAGGEDFDAVSVPMFMGMQAAGEFALSWQAHGLRYGIPATVDRELKQGRDLLVNLSRSVLPAAQARFGAMPVLLLTASPAVLRARLMARGREAGAEIDARLARAGFALPGGIAAIHIDNSGPIADTVRRALAALYPQKDVTLT